MHGQLTLTLLPCWHRRPWRPLCGAERALPHRKTCLGPHIKGLAVATCAQGADVAVAALLLEPVV